MKSLAIALFGVLIVSLFCPAFANEPAFVFDAAMQTTPDFSPRATTSFVACESGVCEIVSPQTAAAMTSCTPSGVYATRQVYRGPVRSWFADRPLRRWIAGRPIRSVFRGRCR